MHCVQCSLCAELRNVLASDIGMIMESLSIYLDGFNFSAVMLMVCIQFVVPFLAVDSFFAGNCLIRSSLAEKHWNTSTFLLPLFHKRFAMDNLAFYA